MSVRKPTIHLKSWNCLPLKWAVADKLRDYLIGTHFTVLTDNSPLAYLIKAKRLSAQEQRWANALAVFDFTIQYRSGKTNVAADKLSRLGRSRKTKTVV